MPHGGTKPGTPVLPLPANRKRPYPPELGEASGDGGRVTRRSKLLSLDLETPAEQTQGLAQKSERAARQQAREAKKFGQNRNGPMVLLPKNLRPKGYLEKVRVFFAPSS